MKNIFVFGFLVFALMGLLVPSLMIDSFAGTDNQGRDKGTKTANGCEKGTAKNNPNCDDGTTPPPGTDTDNDGIPDVDDACINLAVTHWIGDEPDHDGDGTIDSRDKTPCPA